MADHLIHPIASAVTAFVGRAPRGPIGQPRLITSMSGFALTFGGLWPDSHLGYSVRDFFRHGGTAAVIVRVDPDRDVTAGVIRGLRSLGNRRRALERLMDPVGLVVVPPIGADADGITWVDPDPRAITEAIATAERIGAMAVLDPPANWASPADALSGIQQLGQHADAALYFPRIVAPDPINAGRARTFAPSGAIAGVLARTDAQVGVWKAPAGTDATLTVDGLTVAVHDNEQDELNLAGINTLRAFPDASGGPGRPVVWGARTLGPPEWKYVSVRRLHLYLEHSIARGLRWAAFEPNDEPLWLQVQASIETFLIDLWRNGALQGASPQEAFFVRCDRTTMTQNDLDNGRLIVEIGVAPIRPAEFVILRIGAWARG